MKAISIQEVPKTTLFVLLLTFPFFCIGLFAQSSIQQYDELLTSEFTPDGPGAAVLIAKGDEILYRKAFGMANMELGVEMKPEHVFQIGSITKQFTAVAILKLQEEGKLSVKDPLTRFLPDYPTQGKEILIEHLLTHTSGIVNVTSLPNFNGASRIDLEHQEVIDFFKNEPLEFNPGEGYSYSNSGYYLLGIIIEEITGESYAAYIEDELLQPLGMNNSRQLNHDEIIQNRASGYQHENGQYQNAPFFSATLPYAAGELISNVDDLLKWNQALHNNEVLNENSLEQAFTPYRLKGGKEINYAYGWNTDKVQGSRIIEHDGYIFGFYTQAIYLPEEEIYIAVLANCNCINSTILAYKLAGISIGKPYAHEAITLPEEKLQAFTGVYQIKEGDQRRIEFEEGQLYSIRTGGRRYLIKPYSQNQFFIEDGMTTLKFISNDEGKVVEMVSIDRSGEETNATRISGVKIEKTIKLDETSLQEYIGTYEVGPMKVTFSVENGWLMGKPQDDSKEKLFPKGNDTFDVRGVGAQIEFHRQNGEVIGLTFSQGGRNMEGKKI